MTDISIITPALNSADWIGDCIASVAAQSLPVEHVVVDGNSSDDTVEVVRHSDANVRLLTQPAKGIYAALNAGINAAEGDLIGILHADDFYARSSVLQQVNEAFEDPSVGACYGDLCYVQHDQPSRVVRYWRAGDFESNRFLNGWMPPHPTFFVRKSIYRGLGLYRTDLGTAGDYELMVRLLVRHQIKTVYVPRVLVHMRTGGASNATLRARLAANRMDRRAWRVNGLRPYPWTTLAKPLRKVGQWWARPVDKAQ